MTELHPVFDATAVSESERFWWTTLQFNVKVRCKRKKHAIWLRRKEGFIGNMGQLRPHQTDKVICLICKQINSMLKEFKR